MALTVFNQVPMAIFAYSVPIMLVLAAGMYLLLEFGSWIGREHLKRGETKLKETFGVVDGPIFALFGLLVAFTFSSALTRFEGRRALIVEEANAIGTAYLRLDLLEQADRDRLQVCFKKYVDSRIRIYELIPDMRAVLEECERNQALQAQIWKGAVAGVGKSPNVLAGMQLIPALNEMIDITTTRSSAMQFHTPMIIFGMLMALSLITSLLVGYQFAGLKKKNRLHPILFIMTISITCYVILDMEYPRLGFIRMDSADAILRDVRASFGL